MDPSKTAAPPPETKLHFLDYWRIIRIRKTVILSVFLLVVMTTTFVTYVILPESYSSMARIKVERDGTDVPNMSGQPVMYGFDPYFIETEFQVIQSSLILDKVIDNLNLSAVWGNRLNGGIRLGKDQTRQVLKNRISLRPERNTAIINISVKSDDKDEAAKIANEIANVYKKYRFDTRQELIKSGLKIFTSTLEEQGDKIARQQTNVDDLRRSLKVVDIDTEHSSGPGATIEPNAVMHLNALKIENETDYIKQETLLEKLSDPKLSPDDLKQTVLTAAPDPLLSNLMEQLSLAQTKLVTSKKDLGEKNPEFQRTSAMVDDLNAQINDRLKGILLATAGKVASVKAAVEKIERQLSDAKSNDIAVAETSRPYYLAKGELEFMKKFREVLMLRSSEENINLNLPKNTMVEITDPAEPGRTPASPNKALNIILGVIVGVVVGIGLAFFIEYLDTSVKTIDDVERTLQAPVLGVIPQNVGYLLEEGAESPHAEAYRVLRTNLLFSRKDEKLNSLAVVSAGAGEGKSTTIFNLATVFAQSGQRVLIVDSDLRRPTIHKLMNVANTLGLTNYLLKQNTLEEVIQTSRLPSLDFMASGKLPSSSLGILSSAQMKELIGQLKQRYDFVFFDSPPIMGVSDASILASEVDMTLQVIQYRRYPQPMNIRAKQLIEKVGGNLVGIVLNNINMSQDESYYYYSGYYHDYYSKNEEDEPVAAGSNGSAGAKSRLDIKPKY
jgi:capsular exopolysaccharide synthesis family protein